MKKLMILALVMLLLTGCGAAESKTIEIDGIPYDLTAASLELPQGTSIDHYEAVKAALPECDISWQVPFQQGFVANDIRNLTVTDLTQEDMALLAYFPDLETVDARGADPAMAAKLQQEHPELEVSYSVEVCGKSFPSDTTEIILENPDTSGLENLKYLPKLESVFLREPQGSPVQLNILARQLPIYWDKTAFGQVISSETTELDLSEQGISFTEVRDMEESLRWFPNLDLVYFGDVEVDNDTMAAYRQRQAENYKVVWNVELNYRIKFRSDATYFMPRKFYMTVIDRDLENLKYFNDMVTVDLGHMNIFHCEWAASMPNLQFLILADTPMKNIEPLRNCKELIYFEVFDTPVTDFTPLLECTKLRDLNMCWTDGDPEVIAQLTWLERLWWWGRITLPFLNEEEKAMITEAMPNCEIVFRTNTSTGGGWREGELYYKMRDNLGMEYMK